MSIALLALALAQAAEPVPVPDHPLITERADRLQSRGADWLDRALDRRPEVAPVFARHAAERDLPDQLLAVALVESGFANIPARPADYPAAGVWQFIPATARSYGLVVDGSTDERLDLDKSTGAALDLLDDLHAEFGDWGLAFAAYNVGSPAVNRAIAAQGTDDWIALVGAGALPPYAADVMAAITVLEREEDR